MGYAGGGPGERCPEGKSLEDWQTSFYLVSLALFGLVFGSFANVVIWRFPRGESLSSPGSRCPKCGHPVRWHDNIPVVSWFALGGRCRDCGAPIAWRYPLVEALSGALWLSAGVAFGISIRASFAVVLFYLLLVLAFIDLDTMRLPNPMVLALAAVGVVGVAASHLLGEQVVPIVGVADSGLFANPVMTAALGVVLGIVPSLGIALIYGAVRGGSGLGMGDVKLLGAMGLFLGPYVLFAFFGGSVLGTLVGIPVAYRERGGEGARARIPFGPFLALGGVLAAWWGPAVWVWYAGSVGLV
jgi:leader peptidase (prepilin peptidase)/N-methyltransferase